MTRIRSMFLVGVGLVSLCLTACGRSDRKPTFPTTGKVVIGDKAVPNASIVLHPVDDKDPNAVRPRATTKADGSFKLTTYDGEDGAPAGDYRVTVELWINSGRGDEGPTSRLPGKFARPETSGLTAKVNTGPTELSPIVLK